MGCLEVIEPGIAATLQDFGRVGFQKFGVPQSGALDAISLAAANIVVGNEPGVAAIECLAAGLTLKVSADSVTVCLAGTAAPFVIENSSGAVRVPPLRSAVAQFGDMLRLMPPKGGAACYFAVAGGFAVQERLGSRATYARARLGGFEGRALQKGDKVPLRLPNSAHGDRILDLVIEPLDMLRIMRGPNEDYFAANALAALTAEPYLVEAASDRMGLRLRGGELERMKHEELPSQGTTAGVLQVPSNGQPILLLADRQTTGGYPCIATVIGADIAAAGRLAAGMSVRFAEVSREDAVAALRSQRDWLASLPSLLKAAPSQALTAEKLLAMNLIDGVTSGAAPDAP